MPTIPINNNNGCDPISSNCVIWQGRDLPCIKLCKGAKITTVIELLANQLCTLMDTFELSNYDISCFQLQSCPPQDFKSLIQLLIERICANNGGTPGESTAVAGIDTIVSINQAFYYTNPQGDTVTTMRLRDYVTAIGNRINTLIQQITTIQSTLQSFNTRISNLENAETPTFELPVLASACLFTQPTRMDIFLQTLETEFCRLRTYTGDVDQLSSAIQSACNLNNVPRLYGSGNMDGIQGWFNVPQNIAQSISNLWKVVCDIRIATQFIIDNYAPTGIDAIDIAMSGNVVLGTDNILQLTFSGSIPNSYIDNTSGSIITVTDTLSNQLIVTQVMVKQTLDAGITYDIILPVRINVTNILTVSLQGMFRDTATNNQYTVVKQATILGSSNCPTLSIAPAYVTAAYSFTWSGMPALITVQLLDNFDNIIQVQNLNITNTGLQTGTFNNLDWGTDYKMRLSVNGVDCPSTNFTTDSYACLPPLLEAPDTDDTTPEGTTTGNTIAGWQVEYDSYHPIP